MSSFGQEFRMKTWKSNLNVVLAAGLARETMDRLWRTGQICELQARSLAPFTIQSFVFSAQIPAVERTFRGHLQSQNKAVRPHTKGAGEQVAKTSRVLH